MTLIQSMYLLLPLMKPMKILLDGEILFLSNPDYEAKNSYKVRVTINDGAFEITEDFSITLEDVL